MQKNWTVITKNFDVQKFGTLNFCEICVEKGLSGTNTETKGFSTKDSKMVSDFNLTIHRTNRL